MSNETILIVDGDARNRKVLEVSLKKAGYRVVLVDTIEAALDYLRDESPDLVLSDAQLSDGGGVEFCERLRSRSEGAEVPFILLSEDGDWEDKVRGLEAGADDYLSRPVYVNELLTRVDALLKKRERKRLSEGEVEAFRGELDDVTLIDLLETIDREHRTGRIALERDDEEATLLFRDGEIVDATCGKLQGEEAVYRVMLWPGGSFLMEYREDIEATDHVEADTDTLLLEGMKRLEQWDEYVDRLPPFDRVFEADYQQLPDFLDAVPEEAARVARLFDGVRTLRDVVDASPVDDVTAIRIVSRIFDEGMLEDVTPKSEASDDSPEHDSARSHLAEWLHSEDEMAESTRETDEGTAGREPKTTREYYESVSERRDSVPELETVESSSEAYEVVEPEEETSDRDDEAAARDVDQPDAPFAPVDEEDEETTTEATVPAGTPDEPVHVEEASELETVRELERAEQHRRRREAEQLVEQKADAPSVDPEAETEEIVRDEATDSASEGGRSPEAWSAEAEETESAGPNDEAFDGGELDERTAGLGSETTEPDWLADDDDETDGEETSDEMRREFQVEAERLEAAPLEDESDDVVSSPAEEPETSGADAPSEGDAERVEHTGEFDSDESPIPRQQPESEHEGGVSPWGEPASEESSNDTERSEATREREASDESNVPVSFERIDEDDPDSPAPEPASAEASSDAEPSFPDRKPPLGARDPASATESNEGDSPLGARSPEEATPGDSSDETAPDPDAVEADSPDDTADETGEEDADVARTDEYETAEPEEASATAEADESGSLRDGISPVDLDETDSDELGRVSENGELVRVEYDLGPSTAPPEERSPATREGDAGASKDVESVEDTDRLSDASEEESPLSVRSSDDENEETRTDTPTESASSDDATATDEGGEEDEMVAEADAADGEGDAEAAEADEEDEAAVGARFEADAEPESTEDAHADVEDVEKLEAESDATSGDDAEDEVEEETPESEIDTDELPRKETEAPEDDGKEVDADAERAEDDDSAGEAFFTEGERVDDSSPEETFFTEEKEELDIYDEDYDSDDGWRRWAITAAVVGFLGTALGAGILWPGDSTSNGASSDETGGSGSTVATSEEPESTSESSSTEPSDDDTSGGLSTDKADDRATELTQAVGQQAETVASSLDFPSPEESSKQQAEKTTSTSKEIAEASSASADSPTSSSETSSGGAGLSDRVARARRLARSGRNGDALSLLNQLRQQAPNHDEIPALFLQIGSSFQMNKQDCKASRAYRVYLEMRPSGSQSERIRSILDNQLQCE